ncbi:MAG: two-component system response regulator KdpE [Propionivibrio sp.]|uniref:Two-component system response regulator KdpE n=1 Tax=Candidatus Propionivibrio dominans TaxID=2954373 RepID=A0A9D7FFZ5_9RHOO|nr:two-component system response regulator KdpE [Candidatus Propionivibrio dominans]
MSEIRARVLIVEDDANIRRFVRMALESEGHEAFEADSIKRGLIEAGTRRPELIVVDLGLPDGDGVDFIRDLRGWSAAPVIVLSARSSEADKIAALDAGADDYLVKPFGAGELMARVRAQLRRQTQQGIAGEPLIRFGDVCIDLTRRVVERNGHPLHLTPIEYRLLTYLAAQPDRVVTHRQLLKVVWGPGHGEDSHYVRVHMANLRKKIEAEASMPRHLITEAGIGYRFVLGE